MRLCGWWLASVTECEVAWRGELPLGRTAVGGTLRNLDLDDVSLPIDFARDYLVARYSDRTKVHPKVFQDVVASVFRDHGYEAFVTGYIKDGGIDVILQKGHTTIGVQVKRSKNTIVVEQIRSLAGALVLANLTQGVFVTTSRFTRDAKEATTAFTKTLYPMALELIDAERFFDALKIAQRNRYGSIKDLDLSRLVQNLEHLEIERFG